MALANLNTLDALKQYRLGKDEEFESKHARNERGQFTEGGDSTANHVDGAAGSGDAQAMANTSPSGTKYTDWGNLNSDLKTIERNERKPMGGAFDRCAFCFNPITDNKGDKQAWVASTKNSQIIPADVDPNGKHPGDMQFGGYHPVGPECAKKASVSPYVRRMPASGMDKKSDSLGDAYHKKQESKS